MFLKQTKGAAAQASVGSLKWRGTKWHAHRLRFSSYSSTLNREMGVVAKEPDLIFLLALWIYSVAFLLMVFVLITAPAGGAGCISATAAGGAGMGTAFSGALGTVVLPGL